MVMRAIAPGSLQCINEEEAHVWPPQGSNGSANRDSVSRMRETMHDETRATGESILLDAAAAAAALSISQRTFQNLRKRSDFPQNATVVLGPRCVRYRLEALHTFVLDLASRPQEEAKHVRPSGGIRSQEGSGS
jgi:hypothetical protein